MYTEEDTWYIWWT